MSKSITRKVLSKKQRTQKYVMTPAEILSKPATSVEMRMASQAPLDSIDDEIKLCRILIVRILKAEKTMEMYGEIDLAMERIANLCLTRLQILNLTSHEVA